MSTIDADVCLSEELSRAREWHQTLSRIGDVDEDPRCPGGTKGGDCDDKDVSETRNALKKVSREEDARDWTERLSDQRCVRGLFVHCAYVYHTLFLISIANMLDFEVRNG